MEEHNSDYLENMPRLNRIAGQIEGIKKMIENGRNCADILSQLRAVRSAVRAVEGNILQKHFRRCVARSFADEAAREEIMEELKKLFDRYGD